MRSRLSIAFAVASLIIPSSARADNFIRYCFDAHQIVSSQINVYSEISINSVNNTSLGTIKLINDAGSIVKTYGGSAYPNGMKAAQTGYSTQSFTTIDVFGNVNTGRVSIIVGFTASTSQPYPTVAIIEHYTNADGSTAAVTRDQCL